MNLEQFPTSKTAKEMLESVTKGWYEQSYVGKWLYQVMGFSLDKVNEIYHKLPEQFFVESATWGLAYHEQKYGLPIRQELSLEERRKQLRQRCNYRKPMTPYYIEEYIKRMTGFTIQIDDVHDIRNGYKPPKHPNIFQVGILENEENQEIDYRIIEDLVMKVKQSHTIFVMEHQFEFFQKVRTDSAIYFCTSFYPQFNLRPLYLDRTWKLNGKQKLSGYDGFEQIDLYPISIDLQTMVKAKPKGATGIAFLLETKKLIKSSQKMRIPTSMNCKKKGEERIMIQTSAAVRAGTEEIMINKRNVLDGLWSLNGQRKLNGGIYQF